MEAAESVLSERREAFRIITFNRPATLNSFTDEMRALALISLREAMDEPGVRAVILQGAGGNFSAGSDVSQMQGDGHPDPARTRRRLIPLQQLAALIAGGPRPVLAAVEGAAFGAGLSLVTMCDFAVAGEGARFGAAFAKIGYTADCGLIWSLPQRTGMAFARDMLFTGRVVKAAEAAEVGMIDRLVPAGSALDAALEKAEAYLSSAPLSIAAMKAAFVLGPGPLDAVLQLEQQQQPMLGMTADHAEGRLAFKEKRPPRFIGR